MKPFWMRVHVSCPDCGYVWSKGELKTASPGYDCPRCGAHYAHEEFWELHHDKNVHVYAKHTGQTTLVEE